MINYKYILIFYLILLFSEKAVGQYYKTRNYSTNNILPCNSIRAIHKDKTGYLWIGTDCGLCRYDGSKLEIFTSKDGLSGNKIWAITEDKHGFIWFGSYDNGISYYNGKDFKKLELNDTISKKIRCVEYDKLNDCLLFGAHNGLIVRNKGEISFFNNKSLGKENKRLLDEEILQIAQEFNEQVIKCNNAVSVAMSLKNLKEDQISVDTLTNKLQLGVYSGDFKEVLRKH